MFPRTSELIGEPLGEPEPLDGGITNRNFRVRTGSGDYVIRLFGKDTSQLGIDRRAEHAASEAAGRRGRGRGGDRVPRRCGRSRASSTAGRSLPEELRSSPGPGGRRAARRALRRHAAGGVQRLPHRGGLLRGAGRAAHRQGFGEAGVERAREIEAALTGTDHDAGARATRPARAANFIASGDRLRHPRLGVCGDERTLVRPRRPRRQQRATSGVRARS